MADHDTGNKPAADSNKAHIRQGAMTVWRFVGGGTVALLLLGGLIAWTGADSAILWRRMGAIALPCLAVVATAHIAIVWLSCAKWRMLLDRTDPAIALRLGWRRLYAITAVTAAAGTLLSPYIAGLAVRPLAMRMTGDPNMARHAALSGLEMAVDVAVMVVMALVAIVFLSLPTLGTTGWHRAAAAAIVGALLALPLIARLLPTIAGSRAVTVIFRAAAACLPGTARLADAVQRRLGLNEVGGATGGALIAGLTGYSAWRWAVMAARTVFVLLAFFPNLAWTTGVMGFAAVQLSALLAITPGNIGIAEWSWTALAAVISTVSASELAVFALGLRLFGTAAAWLVAVLALALMPRSGLAPPAQAQPDLLHP